MQEYPLFIVDPADQSRKFVGTKQVHPDGSLVWFRRITSEHVMRSGSFGVDAATYDTQFAGRDGLLRVELGATAYEAPFATFELLRKERDLGHGRQYFLAFSHWNTVHPVSGPEKSPRPHEPLIFGTHAICPSCGRRKKPDPDCLRCNGQGYVTT